MTTAKTRTRRWTADERREVIVGAAMEEFAAAGLAGASTEAIARRAGISHAYLFRLFGTKRDLFLATVERSDDLIREAFATALREHEGPKPVQASLGRAYRRLVEDRTTLMFQLHAHAVACGDADVRATVRRGFERLFRWVQDEAGLSPDAARLFIAQGMLINVVAALDLPSLARKEPWVARLFAGTEIDPDRAPAV